MDRLIHFRLAGLVVAVLLGFHFAPAQAATEQQLHLIGPVGQIRVGDTFTVQVQLNSAGQQINAALVNLHVDPQLVAVDHVGREESMFTIWPTEPSWNNTTGTIQINGGRPGGIYAVDGVMATVYLTAKRPGPTTMTTAVGSTSFLHNDQGTPVGLTSDPLDLNISSELLATIALTSPTHPTPTSWSRVGQVVVQWTLADQTEYSYQFSTDPTAVPDDTPDDTHGQAQYDNLSDGVYYFTIKQRSVQGPWSLLVQRRFLIDQTPPADFTIVPVAPSTVGGQTVIGWMAADRTSGVVRSELTVGGHRQGSVTSPLTIKPEWRGQRLTISVVDAAGNIRTHAWQSTAAPRQWAWWWGGGLFLAALLLAVVWWWRGGAFRHSRHY